MNQPSPDNSAANQSPQLETVIYRFEEAWSDGTAPDLAKFLSDDSHQDLQRTILNELVKLDLEYRWRQGSSTTSTETADGRNQTDERTVALDSLSRSECWLLEQYLQHYPQLGSSHDLPLPLILEEYRVRQRWGDRPAHQDYLQRFAQHKNVLSEALSQVDEELATETSLAGSQPVDQSSSQPSVFSLEDLGSSFGDYELLEEIGRGAMGVVYRAHQKSLNREVAIKMILSGGLADEEAIERFYGEAQAVAQLRHPNIVMVHEVSEQDGHHFFSMDYIQGQSLSELIRSHPLTAREAADYVRTIAAAMQSAHEAGVLHRDLKPSNILVDADGQPLITDFGLAKRTDDDSGMTKTGNVVGTPSYMPPEQVGMGDRGEVGPASDVYSLGAILYELLTGRPPFRAGSMMETLMQVLNQEPVSPRLLSPQLDRDLETITLKCLEKDPNRRYADAAQLVADLESWLAGEPIEARRITWMERSWRWCKRKPAMAGLVGVSMAATVALVVGGLWYQGKLRQEKFFADQQWQLAKNRLVEANEAREEAEEAKKDALENADEAQRQRVAAESARQEEQQQREVSESVSNFLLAAFRKPDPSVNSREVRMVDVVTRAHDQLNERTDLDPLIKATLLNALGQTFSGLGMVDRTVAANEQALAIRRQHLGATHSDTLISMINLSLAYQAAGKLDKAVSLGEETLKISRKRHGKDHYYTIVCLNNLAMAHKIIGNLDKAIPLFEEAVWVSRRTRGNSDPSSLTSMSNLGLAYKDAGKLDEAVPLYKEIFELRSKAVGPKHPDTLTSMNNLGQAYEGAGNLDKALPLLEESLELSREILGDNHPGTLISMENLGLAYQDSGKLDKALPLLEETLKMRRQILGTNHPDTINTIRTLGLVYKDAGNLIKAQPLLEELLKLTTMVHGAKHPDTLSSMNNLGRTYRLGKRLDKALPLLKETLTLRQEVLGANHPDTLTSMNNLALAYQDAGNLDKALPLLEAALELSREILGDNHPETLICMHNLGLAYKNASKLDKALPLLEEALKRQRDLLLGEGHPNTSRFIANLASAYRVDKKLNKALPLLEESLRLKRKFRGKDHPDTFVSMNNLGLSYQDAGNLDKALPLLEEALELGREILGDNHPETLISMHNLGLAYQNASKLDKALLLYEESLQLRRRQFPGHWRTYDAAAQLGGVLAKMKQYQEAEPLLLEGVQGMQSQREEIPLRSRGRIKSRITYLVKLYEAWDKPIETAKWKTALANEIRRKPQN